ncbi:MAG TPA: sorbosone dehydrogenase family protein [Methylomirabilota bacterium]|nr:sorbosone dehydrogenase family protein [Methylomirabilota bacterium]
MPGSRHTQLCITLLFTAAALAGCGEAAKLPLDAGIGPDPALPPPEETVLPTVQIAPAKGWPGGIKPAPAAGTAVAMFASGLDHPRWVYVLPNGDVLVAETNAPPRPDDNPGLKGMLTKMMMKRAGSGVPSANRIRLLRDADGDGLAEHRTVFLEGLNSPFGMALVGGDLYVANTDAVMRYPYTEGATRIAEPGTKVVDLPAGTINHHWTKNVIASRDGSRLYVTVGSNSNVAERGIEHERERAAIWEVDPRTGAYRVFASGLRNPNGLAWEPSRNVLWTVVNERDELGSDLVPDYLTSVKADTFYGWPWSYFGQNVDRRVKPPAPDLVARAVRPDYALGSHVAALGLAWADGSAWPAPFRRGMFIGQHGSWNRKPRSGYNVVFVPFQDGMPSGKPVEVLTGFVGPEGDAYGRPVGVAIDKRNGLLVADDVGNVIWRVTAAPASP